MSFFFVIVVVFFNDTATTEIYTLSLHDALPIFGGGPLDHGVAGVAPPSGGGPAGGAGVLPVPVVAEADQAAAGGSQVDRKSTRLNSSHANISYAVFCLKKKKKYKKKGNNIYRA